MSFIEKGFLLVVPSELIKSEVITSAISLQQVRIMVANIDTFTSKLSTEVFGELLKMVII